MSFYDYTVQLHTPVFYSSVIFNQEKSLRAFLDRLLKIRYRQQHSVFGAKIDIGQNSKTIKEVLNKVELYFCVWKNSSG